MSGARKTPHAGHSATYNPAPQTRAAGAARPQAAAGRAATPAAPPVYRPQATPRVLQTKPAIVRAPVSAAAGRAPHAAPPHAPKPSAAVSPRATAFGPTPAPRAGSAAVQPKSHPHPRPGAVNAARAVGPPVGPRGVVQRYIGDPGADDAACVSAASERRDRYRDMLTDEEYEGGGANHVTGAVLEYRNDKGMKVKPLKAYVSGNPKNRSGSLYPNVTKLTKDRKNSECSEPKVLGEATAALASIIRDKDRPPRPTLYLATEWTPCARCEGRIKAWRENHPDVEVHITAGTLYTSGKNKSTWTYPSGLPKVLTLPPLDPTQLSGYLPAPKIETKPKTEASRSYNPFAALADSKSSSSSSSSSGSAPVKKNIKKPNAPTQTPTQAPTQAPTQTTTRSVTKAPSRSAIQAPTQAPTGQVVVNNDICSHVWGVAGILLTVGTVVTAVWLNGLGYGWPGGSGE